MRPDVSPLLAVAGALTTEAPRDAVRGAIASFDWHEAPYGDPPFALMNRHEKARLLSGYVHRMGARPAVVAYLLAQPLPDHLRTEVSGWRLNVGPRGQ